MSTVHSHTAVLVTLLVAFGSGVASADGASHSKHIPMLSLHHGNHWVYVRETSGVPGPGIHEVRVTGRIEEGGRRVAAVENYMFPISDSDVLFFTDDCARTCELYPRLRSVQPEKDRPPRPLNGPWYACQYGFDLAMTVALPEMDDDCVHGSRGHVAAMGEPVTVPAGTFPWSITIDYDEHPCADNHLVSETLVPGIGLVRRTVARFTGTERWSLCMAIVDGEVLGSPSSCANDGRAEGDPAPVLPTTWGAVKSTFVN